MNSKPRDPLLTAGKVLTNILKILLVLAGLALLIAIPAFLLSKSHVAAALGENADSLAMVLTAISALLLAGAAIMAGAFVFFQILGKIIDTVRDGDPFVGANADRLEKMGWIAIAFQVVAIPLSALAGYLQTQFPTETVQIDVSFSFTGVLLAIVLFILARVFRHGAAMREDLEGTV